MAEPRLALFGKAQLGRDIYRACREQINRMRLQGIEPIAVWVGQDTVDAMHALWSIVAKEYDELLPPKVAGVPMKLGVGLGRAQFEFEYAGKQDARPELRQQPRDNPLPDND